MNNAEAKEQPEDYIASMREVIENAPRKIQDELDRSGNTWLACLTTRATVVKGFAQMGKMEGQVSEEKYNKIKDIIDRLDAKRQYWEDKIPKGEEAADEVKEELMADFNSILGAL